MLVPFTNFPFLLQSKKLLYNYREEKKIFAIHLLSDKLKVHTKDRQERNLTMPGQRKFCEGGDI